MTPEHRILMVEDLEADAELAERELRRAGLSMDIRRVEEEETFRAALASFQPDLILADYSLPKFSAVEALRVLREEKADVPLLLVTGSHSEEIAVDCMKQGAEDYILKSSLRRLPAAVRNALRHRAAAREKAETEAALRARDEQYRLIAEHTRDLVCLLDQDQRFLYASPSFERALGHPGEAPAGTPLAAWIHPDDASALQRALDEALFFRESRTAEVRFRLAGGGWLAFEAAGSFIYGDTGKPQRVLLVCRDTTERKRAEREIRKLAAFPRFNPNPVLEFAADGAVTYFNDAALQMARALGRSHPESILPLGAATIVKTCLSTGEARLRLEHPAGRRTIAWSFFPVTAIGAVHCYAEDVTDARNLEAQLRQVQKMDSVGQLAAGVAHDFNNILTVIRGHAGLLNAAAGLDADMSESCRQIALAAERASTLTRQLLLFSRKQVMQPQLLDLNDVVDNLVKMLRSLVGAKVALKRGTADRLPPVHADRGMMEQVLVNLAVNARDAMPRGGSLTIATGAVCHETPAGPLARAGHFVCLRVTDTGIGMDSATQARIFEPFFTTKEAGKGTGLGLATVYGIVQQHDGWIEVESQVGQGTTFKVYLPACTRGALAGKSPPPAELRGGDETILLVEDERPLRELVREILSRRGYRVLEAATGANALDVWREHKDAIDLVLTDLMLPGSHSGRDAADQMLAERGDLKVIYSTGYSLELAGPDSGLVEGHNLLHKPYEPDTLVRQVRERLDAPRQP